LLDRAGIEPGGEHPLRRGVEAAREAQSVASASPALN
jgi:hypothetical protein